VAKRPQGTELPTPLSVQESSWEVWTNGNGETEERNTEHAAAANAPVTFYIQSGDGSLDSLLSSVTLSLTADGESTELAAGEQRYLLATVTQTTWEVWTSNYGNTMETLIGEGSVEQVPVYFTIEEGDGMVDWQATSDPGGVAAALFQTVTSGSRVRAWGLDVDGNPLATTDLDLYLQAEEWTHTSNEGTVDPNPLVITTTALPAGTVGADYNATLAAANGSAPYDFTLAGGGLPFGYTLQSNGILTGVGDSSTGSQQAGTYTFTVQVSDNAGQVAQKELTLELLPMPVPPLAITTTELPMAGVGLPYAYTLQAAGGSEVEFSAAGLPPGLELSSGGTLNGTVIEAGNWQIDVTAQEMGTGGELRSATAALALVVASPEVAIVSGNGQVAWGGDAFEPLTVRLSVAGLPVPGAQVTFDGVPVITDAGGMAQWTPGAVPAAPDVFTIAANSGDTGVTFTLGSAGLPVVPDGPPIQANPVVGDPAPPAKVSLADAETAVESRWVSTKRGSVQATYSAGTAFGFVNGQWTTFVEGWGPPPYDASGTR